MRFTPVYNVMYHGEVHRAGQPFEIDPADAEEMGVHGVLEHVAPVPAAMEPPGRKRRKQEGE